MRHLLVPVVLGSLILASCSSLKKLTQDPSTDTTVDLPAAERAAIWSALLQTLDERGLEITKQETSYLWANQRFRSEDDLCEYCVCEGVKALPSFWGRVGIEIKGSDKEPRMRMNVTYYLMDHRVQAEADVLDALNASDYCRSSGRIEAEILDGVVSRLAPEGGQP